MRRSVFTLAGLGWLAAMVVLSRIGPLGQHAYLFALLHGTAFGLLGVMIRKTALSQLGQFPPLMLMEDVEFPLRLKSNGPTVFVCEGVQVPGRRWHSEGFGQNLTVVLRLLTRHLFERRLGIGSGNNLGGYYRRYYIRR